MNTSQFTYRDFVTYFLTGVLFIILLSILFSEELNIKTSEIFKEYTIVAELKILVTIAAIAIIYFVGHLIHWIDYAIMKSYVKFYKLNKKFEYKFIYRVRKFYETLFYKQRITYQIAAKIKEKGAENLPFQSNNSFWEKCAELQVMNRFASCEYWYSLNDLFKGLYVVCLICIPIAIWKGEITIAIIIVIIAFINYWRARQFSEYFVNTVIRNKKIKTEANN